MDNDDLDLDNVHEHSEQDDERDYAEGMKKLEALEIRKSSGEPVDDDIRHLVEYLEYLGDSLAERHIQKEKRK